MKMNKIKEVVILLDLIVCCSYREFRKAGVRKHWHKSYAKENMHDKKFEALTFRLRTRRAKNGNC